MSTRGPWEVTPEHSVLHPPTASGASPHVPSAGLTYEPFYGLHEQPFSVASNPAFFHHGQAHAATFQALLAGIRRRERLSVLTGDIGTGKTTLCRAVLQNLDRETFSAFVADPFASREDLLKVLLMEFGVMSLDDLTSGRLKTASRTELSYLLYDFLGKLAPLQAFAVVIIDEAQNLSLPLLEELRILSDFDGRDRQLQVVLVGQLELRHKLKLPEMRQVDQRVAVRCHLEPLNRGDIAAYVAHRLRVAGGTPERVAFSAGACDAVYRASNGVPRVINRICDRALHHGHLGRVSVIEPGVIEAAVRELEHSAADLAYDFAPDAEWDAARGAVSSSTVTIEEPLASPVHEATASAQSPRPASVQPRPPVVVPKAARHHHHHERPALSLKPSRALKIALAVVLMLSMVIVGVATVRTLWEEAEETGPLPVLPEGPPPATPIAFAAPTHPEMMQLRLPGAGGCTIDVALFETQQAAAWLVEELTAGGFGAYQEALDLPNRGAHHLVSVGPFATWVKAQSDLQRLREARPDEGARLRCE